VSRRLEERQLLGDGWKTEWEPYKPEDVDMTVWRDKDFADYVRRENAARKKRGDSTRLRSVEVDDE
jgi:hypothetical protein